MDNKRGRFLSANQELCEFLQRVDGLAGGTCWISERDVQALSDRLASLAPELRGTSHSTTFDADLQDEIVKYIVNLRALQAALEKVRCIMLARKLQLEAERRHLNGLQDWLAAYHQTA